MVPARLVIKGEPIAKGRPRGVKQGGRISMVTPQKTVDAEAMVRRVAKDQFKLQPLQGPLIFRADFYFGIRPSWTKTKRAALLGQPMVQKPDVDNVAKLYADALNGILYEDDQQIMGMITFKWWAMYPSTEINVIPFSFASPGVKESDLFGGKMF